jgi:hypothetical protein
VVKTRARERRLDCTDQVALSRLVRPDDRRDYWIERDPDEGKPGPVDFFPCAPLGLRVRLPNEVEVERAIETHV